jgi:hypothetical protein
MIKNNNSTKTARTPFGDALVSRYEVLLLCGAAFLLAVAYPAREPAKMTPVISADMSTQLTDQLISELEKHNEPVEVEPDSTTVLLEPIESELMAEAPVGEPAS